MTIVPPNYTNTFFLFQNQSQDATSEAYVILYPNKKAVIKAIGNFDGATVKFQNTFPQSNPEQWIDLRSRVRGVFTFTETEEVTLSDLVPNEKIRAVLSGSGANTNITISVEVT